MEVKASGKSLLAAAVIAVGLIGCGLALRSGIIRFRSMERTVSVKGLSEVEVPADKVVWRISFTSYGNDIEPLYSKMEKDSERIKSFLRGRGLEDGEIFPSNTKLNNLQDQYAYSNRVPQYKYSLYASLTVSSDKIDTVRSLVSSIAPEMSKFGIAVSGYASYSFTGLNSLKPKMIEDATANARASAQKFAEDSHSRIGKIKTANQGVFSVDDLDETAPYIKKVRVVTTVVYYLD